MSRQHVLEGWEVEEYYEGIIILTCHYVDMTFTHLRQERKGSNSLQNCPRASVGL